MHALGKRNRSLLRPRRNNRFEKAAQVTCEQKKIVYTQRTDRSDVQYGTGYKFVFIRVQLCYVQKVARGASGDRVCSSGRLFLGAGGRSVSLDGRVDVVLGARARSAARRTRLLVQGLVERALFVLRVVGVFPLGEDASLALLALLHELRLMEELSNRRSRQRRFPRRGVSCPASEEQRGVRTLPLIFSSVPFSESAMPLLPA